MNEPPASNLKRTLQDVGQWLITLSDPDGGDTNDRLSVHTSAFDFPTSAPEDAHFLARLAKEEIAERLRRRSFIDAEFLGEPAWDILLDLFVAQILENQISIKSACLSSGVPTTTGLRWIEALEESGHIRRTKDDFDKRRYWLRLTRKGLTMMASYFRVRALKRGRFVNIDELCMQIESE